MWAAIGCSGSGAVRGCTQETKATRQALAQRWILHPAKAERRNHVWSYDFVKAETGDAPVL